MFKKPVQKLSYFSDPIAIQIDWTPAIKGVGATIQTHKLVKVNSNRLEFRASRGAIVFYLLFLLVGIGLMISAPSSKMPLACGLLGGLFVIGGSCILYSGTAPIVFDKQKGFFWKGRTPDKVFDKAELEKIHALQIISKYKAGTDVGYDYSYELNLVLKNGNRINVVDHGDQNKLREDAETLSAFLKKPVWDATCLIWVGCGLSPGL